MAILAAINGILLIRADNKKNYPHKSSTSPLLQPKFFGNPLVKTLPKFPSIGRKSVPLAGPRNEVEQESKEEVGKQSVSLSLDDVNPVGLGRKSRQIFDEVWRKFSELGQLSRTPRNDEEYDSVLVGGPMCEFTIPAAADTTVLVVGATSRIGRILVRKLMLRGYKVKALVRRDDPETLEMLPRSVKIVVGDVGEPSTLKDAVEGCNKVIYCATARSTITGDLNRVDHLGVYNLSKSFQDYNHKLAQMRAGRSSKSKLYFARFTTRVGFGRVGNFRSVKYFINRQVQCLQISIDLFYAFESSNNQGMQLFEIIVLNTMQFRIPFSAFRPVKPEDPPLDPFLVHTLRIRFEPRKQKSTVSGKQAVQDSSSFKMILEYIKALPSGQETDFVLVSCTGSGIEPSTREKVLKAKQAGEKTLRISGLGYTIIRPGPLQEEPGGQHALVFDQGNRITQGISCADVADICVKALHDSTARNKSFDVCYEYVAEKGQGLYELVAHLPDKSNNYLTPALSVLEKNT
uniref:NAD(P)-binding domain-containing protein n=1 Tax=Picea sitchensis TaxID=3332 RepID=B8LQR3_PICSI|nr:unknown [Picea sitchensis]